MRNAQVYVINHNYVQGILICAMATFGQVDDGPEKHLRITIKILLPLRFQI